MASANGTTVLSAAAKLRTLLVDENRILVCPGVYDGFTARIALKEGFETLYMTGAGTSMSCLGEADLGIATFNELAANASMIASLDRSVPLIADADVGGTGALQVKRTVQQYISGGVAALHLEDQVVTKRCGHLANKELVDEDIFVSRIRAAVMAREQMPGGDIVIIARTDSLQGLGYDVAVQRLKKAVEAGADIAFLEGLTTKEQMQRVCKDLAPTPVLLNMVTGGVTPSVTVDEARNMGFKIIIFPGFALGPVYKAVTAAAQELKKEGTINVDLGPGVGPRALFDVCGLRESMAFDMAAGGISFKNGV